jgi:hypothetical protein
MRINRRSVLFWISAAAGGMRRGFARAASQNGRSAAPGRVGGYAIGQPGSGLYSGFKLTAASDFSALPSRWHPSANPDGAWASGPLHVAGLGIGTTSQWAMGMDPYWRGARSQSPTPRGLDVVSLAPGGGVDFNIRVPDGPLQPTLPTSFSLAAGGRPPLIAGQIYSAPSYAISAKGDFIVECVFQAPPGKLVGYWSSFLWTSGQFWPDEGEIDAPEIFKGLATDTPSRPDGQSFVRVNSITNALEGGRGGSETPYFRDIEDTRPYWFMARKTAAGIEFYDDADRQGVLALRGVARARASRYSGAHDLRLGSGAAPYPQKGMSARTFNAADWPADTRVFMFRAWTPADGPDNLPTVDLGTVDVAPGQGGFAFSLPPAAVMWAGGWVPDVEQVIGGFYSYDSPGGPTRNRKTKLPGGMAYTPATRTLTWDVPPTEGGSTCVYMFGTFDAGGPARRARVTFRVAPARQPGFPDVTVVAPGQSLDQTVAYTDFHSGDLTHTYRNVAADQSWVNVRMGEDDRSFRLTGAAPSVDQSVAITGECVNSAGQVTAFTSTIVISASRQTGSGASISSSRSSTA